MTIRVKVSEGNENIYPNIPSFKPALDNPSLDLRALIAVIEWATECILDLLVPRVHGLGLV